MPTALQIPLPSLGLSAPLSESAHFGCACGIPTSLPDAREVWLWKLKMDATLAITLSVVMTLSVCWIERASREGEGDGALTRVCVLLVTVRRGMR